MTASCDKASLQFTTRGVWGTGFCLCRILLAPKAGSSVATVSEQTRAQTGNYSWVPGAFCLTDSGPICHGKIGKLTTSVGSAELFRFSDWALLFLFAKFFLANVRLRAKLVRLFDLRSPRPHQDQRENVCQGFFLQSVREGPTSLTLPCLCWVEIA